MSLAIRVQKILYSSDSTLGFLGSQALLMYSYNCTDDIMLDGLLLTEGPAPRLQIMTQQLKCKMPWFYWREVYLLKLHIILKSLALLFWHKIFLVQSLTVTSVLTFSKSHCDSFTTFPKHGWDPSILLQLISYRIFIKNPKQMEP